MVHVQLVYSLGPCEEVGSIGWLFPSLLMEVLVAYNLSVLGLEHHEFCAAH